MNRDIVAGKWQQLREKAEDELERFYKKYVYVDEAARR